MVKEFFGRPECFTAHVGLVKSAGFVKPAEFPDSASFAPPAEPVGSFPPAGFTNSARTAQSGFVGAGPWSAADYDYELPEHFIAQAPTLKRDECKMLVYDKETDSTEIGKFRDILGRLRAGDVAVINETRVMPARLFGVKDTGAKVEILLLKKLSLNKYEALIKPARRVRAGDSIDIAGKLTAVLVGKDENEGTAVIELRACGTECRRGAVAELQDNECRTGRRANTAGRELTAERGGVSVEEIIDEVGVLPLPHYIKSGTATEENYNTVYARVRGSAAAPTAGLHWTEELIKSAKDKGVIFAPVVLHVGLGTFRPVKVDDITKHKMHSEYYCIPEATADIISRARADGRRIIAVGTTALRTLEGCEQKYGGIKTVSDKTDVFIYPPYKFRVADALITNFHLPRSTLLMLVAAFIGREKTLELYETAKKNDFRFYSFGDCMFLIR